MKAAFKYLRNLGEMRRKGCEKPDTSINRSNQEELKGNKVSCDSSGNMGLNLNRKLNNISSSKISKKLSVDISL